MTPEPDWKLQEERTTLKDEIAELRADARRGSAGAQERLDAAERRLRDNDLALTDYRQRRQRLRALALAGHVGAVVAPVPAKPHVRQLALAGPLAHPPPAATRRSQTTRPRPTHRWR